LEGKPDGVVNKRESGGVEGENKRRSYTPTSPGILPLERVSQKGKREKIHVEREKGTLRRKKKGKKSSTTPTLKKRSGKGRKDCTPKRKCIEKPSKKKEDVSKGLP